VKKYPGVPFTAGVALKQAPPKWIRAEDKAKPAKLANQTESSEMRFNFEIKQNRQLQI